ncbi:IPT/TIG domain-containing protein [Chryseolinea lacunae]|uniref:IPT/TIG domain-containing protein n=1 Tax=Chryseolinea lacunae TaxID=2801331 RepID=A0ABS1KK74_9BACT|nr:IPT/TIG domain-containing protein [Chryseolinea lacunae]MBL0739859.1 IPT/TIG domain-containing protein [Chryseolinea lacunae]
MYSKVLGLLLVISAIFLFRCGDTDVNETRPYPSLDTKPVSSVDANGAIFTGEIIATGTGGISDHGFVYDDIPNPQVGLSEIISLGETASTGTFVTLANRNLKKDKTYYVRAYAYPKNKTFVVYGQQVEFVSLGGKAPELKDFFPKQGLLGDTVIFVGSGFSTVSSNNSISFNRRYATLFKATPDTLWCTVPATASAGENEVAVTLDQITITHPTRFVLKTPVISTVTPTAVSSGDTLTITGIDFPVDRKIVETSIFQRRQFVLSTSRTQMKVIVPPDPVVTEGPITITSGTHTAASPGKIVLQKPVITNFTPSVGTGGTEITIQGNYFNPLAANNAVSINGVRLTILEWSRTMLKVKVPAGIKPGLYPISITVSTQTAVSTGMVEIK